ncbi:MAG: 4-deoxy-4-formamido-L-arabinose-phosphoundecaprenol deformylase [Gammaproteobacteria bacterium]|nr:4-deoxy-4-formamido-L-arabinose-phosphoundecaprenol deformylase [Gammaproteobacteria bacterium]
MSIALKIDVDTLRGTLEGVPALVRVLQRHAARASFLFSLGPDHTGRALRRVFRRGFLRKVLRTSVGAHYGWKTLCYGTLLPGPDIGRRAGHVMRQARDAGFEAGIHCYDHVRWQDYVAVKDGDWTRREMERAAQRFQEIFGAPARVFGAAGWQINAHALRLEQQHGYACCSDTRGTHPFLPAMNGERFTCPQLPTTLPTLDELIGVNGVTEHTVVEELLRLSERPLPHGHVYTLHAELEGMKLMPVFERLLRGWRDRGHELISLQDVYRGLEIASLPVHEVRLGEIPGRSGTLALQGEETRAM